MILTLALVVSGCLPVTLLSVADSMYKNYKLDVLETKIDKLEFDTEKRELERIVRQNSIKFKTKEETKEEPKLDPYVGMDAFTRSFYETMYPKLK